MKKCPKGCKPIIGVDAKFCYVCGSELVKVEDCSCGHYTSVIGKFCPGCGKEVKR